MDQTPKASWQCPSSGLPGSNQDISVLSLGSELVMFYPSDGNGQFQHKNSSLQRCQQIQYEEMQAQNPASQCSGLPMEECHPREFIDNNKALTYIPESCAHHLIEGRIPGTPGTREIIHIQEVCHPVIHGILEKAMFMVPILAWK